MDQPERINDMEIYSHHGFLKVLEHCDKKYGMKNETEFTTCIKVAGTNFRESLAQW